MFERCTIHLERYLFSLVCFFVLFVMFAHKKMHCFHFHLVVGEAGGTSGQDYLYPIS